MKTRHLFLFSSLLLSALWLVGCSEDVVTGGDDNTPQPTEVTRFTSGNPSPDNIFGPFKTLMDNAGNHYWTEGDHIWVKSGSTYYKDVDNTVLGTQAVADFSIPGTLTDPTYDVFYVGQNSPQASSGTASTLQVTIASTQHQPIPNNAEHFGRSGDCGTATATRVASGSSSVNNDYSFRLSHRAAYLVFAPKDPNIETAGNAKLKKIKVESNNALCGTYDFTTGHLTSGTSTGNTITLEVGDEFDGVKGQDFPIPSTQDVRTNGAFMVIQPGTHQLTITYTVEYYGIEQEISKTVASREFLENKYYTIGHTLNVEVPEFVFYFPDTYYMWDAQQWYWYGQAQYPTISNTQYSTYPRSKSEDPLRWYNDTNIPVGYSNPIEYAATNSAKDMPNVNDLTWYVQYGDPHLDGTTEWSLGGVKQRGGLWLKKKQVIINEIQSSQPNVFVRYRSTDGSDWRNKQNMTLIATPTTGRPADTSDYFFLPAMGFYYDGQLHNVGTFGRYWSSSPEAGNDAEYAYGLCFDNGGVKVNTSNYSFFRLRYFGFVAGSRPDGSPWFK